VFTITGDTAATLNAEDGTAFTVWTSDGLGAPQSMTTDVGASQMSLGSSGFEAQASGGTEALEVVTTGVRITSAAVSPSTLLGTDASGYITSVSSLGTLTVTTLIASNIVMVTNVINTGVIPCGKTTYTNLTGNITLAGFSGVDLTYNNWAKLYVTNASGPSTPRSVTMPAPVRTSTHSFVFDTGTAVVWVTNDVNLSFDIAAWATNVAAIRWSP